MLGQTFQLATISSFVVGVPINCLLIWLILTKTSKTMKDYKRILLQTCILDLYVLMCGLLFQPIFTTIEDTPIIFLNGLLRNLSNPFDFVAIQFYIFGSCLTVASSVIQFAYRYLVLCRYNKLGGNLENSRYAELDRQITRILLVQACVPLLNILISSFGVASTKMFGNKQENYNFVYSILILCWLPVLSPLITIFTVKHYKDVILCKRKQQLSYPMSTSKFIFTAIFSQKI
uniref:Uncharacterized protein n=1 Tax=Ditylenchus dipsaci TaxID=166011 RepID=A0A915CSE1_9BILA